MTSSFKKNIFARLPVFIYLGIIFYASSRPLPELCSNTWHLDKICHFFAYAVAGILAFRAFMSVSWFKKPSSAIIASIVSVSLYGLSDEIHQSFSPYRCADIYDFAANVLGCTAGVISCARIFRIHEKTRHQQDIPQD